MLKDIVRTQKQKSLAGVFKRYADKRLIEKESEIAWEKAIKEKHDLIRRT